MIRDRDASYGTEFRRRIQSLGTKEVITAARSPWQNGIVERLIGSIRAHCGIRSTSARTWNEIIRCLRSWLQRASRLQSFHCHRVRPESETQPTFAMRLSVKSAPPVTIRQAQVRDRAR